jgi:four helix bundle protein
VCSALSQDLRRKVGMTNPTKRTGAQLFVALEVALEVISELRGLVEVIRTRDAKMAQQIVASASSIAANVAEGNKRAGRDRLHLFRIAAGSAAETRAHLRVALAWGWIVAEDTERALEVIDRELGLLWGLTR